MATIDNNDILKGSVDHAKEDIPSASFFLKKDVDVNEGDDVSITGNYTSEGATVEQTIFKGFVDDVDLQEIQKIRVVSKAEEIDKIKPDGLSRGYTECQLGDLINNLCNEITCSRTRDTLIIRPNGDVSTGAWTDVAANNNGLMWDDIDEEVSDGDSGAIYDTSGNTYSARLELDFTTHSLSGDYHYSIWKVDIIFTMHHGGTPGPYWVNFYDGHEWAEADEGVISNISYLEYTHTFNLSGISEDDIANFKCYIWKTITPDSIVLSKCEIIVYYQYYPNLSKGAYHTTQEYSENKTLRQIFEWAKLQELKTWYLTPDLEFLFNDGNIDSGVDISSTDNIKGVKGNKQIKNFDKVVLLGGYVNGVQLTATAGAGNKIYTDTFANVIDLTILENLAAQILTNKQTYPLSVGLYRRDVVKGLIQPGEEVSIEAGIKFNRSTKTITPGQYKIDGIKYFIVNGVYTTSDLKLSDGLVFKRTEEPNKPDQETNEAVSQVASYSTLGGGGNLGDLGDVIITAPADNEGVHWDAGTSKWINQTPAEAGLSAVGHTHDDRYYTEAETYTQAEVDAHNWTEADITDLDKYTQAQVDALTWLEEDITDLDHDAVKILTKEFTEDGGDLANADIMVYRVATGKWELEEKPAAGANPALDDVTDVTITDVADNELLTYDNATSEWINQTAAEVGLSGKQIILPCSIIPENLVTFGGYRWQMTASGHDIGVGFYLDGNIIDTSKDVEFLFVFEARATDATLNFNKYMAATAIGSESFSWNISSGGAFLTSVINGYMHTPTVAEMTFANADINDGDHLTCMLRLNDTTDIWISGIFVRFYLK